MPPILSSQILKTCSTLVTRLTISYRIVPGLKPFSIQSLKGIAVRNISSMEKEEHRTQYNPLQTSKQKSVWKVVDEWPPRGKRPSSSSHKKQKRTPKNQSRKEEQIERMRRFLVKNDAEFQKDSARAKRIVREKKDDENNFTKVKPVRTQSTVKESSKDKNSAKSKEAEGLNSCQSTSHSHAGKKEEFEFSVLSYNILADNLMLAHPELYRKCESAALDWNYRWEGIKREILAFQFPDIICLQEVQFHNPDHATSHIIPFLSRHGYHHVIKTKTGDKVDGCLTAFKKDKFQLEESSDVEYKVDRVPVLGKPKRIHKIVFEKATYYYC